MKSKKRIKNNIWKLSKYFKCNDWETVSSFLLNKKKIVKFLLEIRKELIQWCRHCDLLLELNKTEEEEIIFVIVNPNRKISEDDMMEQLEMFDFWLDNFQDSQYISIVFDENSYNVEENIMQNSIFAKSQKEKDLKC